MTAPGRIVIVGGPSRGKSTIAHELHTRHGTAVFCGDPESTVVYKKPYTTYLPEGLDFAGESGAGAWVAEHWFAMNDPWICEGHVMARSLRRWLANRISGPAYPCDRIIVLDREAHRATTRGQESMHVGVMRVWREIADYFDPISTYLGSHDDAL